MSGSVRLYAWIEHATSGSRHLWSEAALIGASPPRAYSSPPTKHGAGRGLPLWTLRPHGFGETGAESRGPFRATCDALGVATVVRPSGSTGLPSSRSLSIGRTAFQS
jgi:hypothetical protein